MLPDAPARLAADPAQVDRSRCYVPEELNPLYHTALYGSFSAAQRIRFNQLWALYMNETMIFMETALPAMLARNAMCDPSLQAFHADIRSAMADERVHAALFGALNRKAEPAWYATADRVLRRDDGAAHFLLGRVLGSRLFLPVLLWLIFMCEEKAVNFGRLYRAQRDRLDPLFCRVYLEHDADEACHCDCDQRLLDHVWPRLPPWHRRFSAAAFRVLTRHFFTAPRQGMRVVDAWLTEFPELRHRRRELAAEFARLPRNPGFVCSMSGPEAIPMTLAKMAGFSELAPLRAELLALDPGGGEAQ